MTKTFKTEGSQGILIQVPKGSSDFQISASYHPYSVWLDMKGRDAPMPIGNLIHPLRHHQLKIAGTKEDADGTWLILEVLQIKHNQGTVANLNDNKMSDEIQKEANKTTPKESHELYKATVGKYKQLEKEISEGASKRDMQHTLSKMWMFSAEIMDDFARIIQINSEKIKQLEEQLEAFKIKS